MNLKLFFSLPYIKDININDNRVVKLPLDIKYKYENSNVFASVRIVQDNPSTNNVFIYLTYQYNKENITMQCFKAQSFKFENNKILIKKISY